MVKCRTSSKLHWWANKKRKIPRRALDQKAMREHFSPLRRKLTIFETQPIVLFAIYFVFQKLSAFVWEEKNAFSSLIVREISLAFGCLISLIVVLVKVTIQTLRPCKKLLEYFFRDSDSSRPQHRLIKNPMNFVWLKCDFQSSF